MFVVPGFLNFLASHLVVFSSETTMLTHQLVLSSLLSQVWPPVPALGIFCCGKQKMWNHRECRRGVTGVQGLSDRIHLALILTKELCGWAGNGTAQGECLRGHREQARSLSVLHCSLQGDIFLSPLTTVLTGASSAQKTCSLECHHPEAIY